MGRRIAKRRKQLGIKQNVLAEKLNISNNHLSGIENGKFTPGLDVFINICIELNVTPDFLLMGVMRSNNVPQNIADTLRICKPGNIEIVEAILKVLVDKNMTDWNNDNYV